MFDFIAIGNVSIDLYFQGKSFTHDKDRYHLAIGGKYFADKFYEDIGGGGCNVAAGMAVFGYQVGLLCKIGNNPFKDLILKKLRSKKISTELCQFQNDYYKISAIFLTEKGERTIINYETPTTLWQAFKLSSEVKKAKNVYLAALPHLKLADKVKIIEFFKGPQVLTIVNLAVTDCRRPINELIPLFDGLDILILNSHEFSDLIKKPYSEINFEKIKIDIPILKNRILVVTDGEKGSYAYANNQVFSQPAIKPKKIIDTTGCGDGYTAGFIAEFLKTQDIKKSMMTGSQYAAKIIEKIGAN
ncbi:MAG: carbohydrate kinase family protein [Microgenomates group bacterium]|nr:carbohydrate kinase family protein [Microgenomates group bacterium]